MFISNFIYQSYTVYAYSFESFQSRSSILTALNFAEVSSRPAAFIFTWWSSHSVETERDARIYSIESDFASFISASSMGLFQVEFLNRNLPPRCPRLYEMSLLFTICSCSIYIFLFARRIQFTLFLDGFSCYLSLCFLFVWVIISVVIIIVIIHHDHNLFHIMSIIFVRQ